MKLSDFKKMVGIKSLPLYKTKSGRGITTIGNKRILTSSDFNPNGDIYIYRSFEQVDGTKWEFNEHGVDEIWFLSNKKSPEILKSFNNKKLLDKQKLKENPYVYAYDSLWFDLVEQEINGVTEKLVEFRGGFEVLKQPKDCPVQEVGAKKTKLRRVPVRFVVEHWDEESSTISYSINETSATLWETQFQKRGKDDWDLSKFYLGEVVIRKGNIFYANISHFHFVWKSRLLFDSDSDFDSDYSNKVYLSNLECARKTWNENRSLYVQELNQGQNYISQSQESDSNIISIKDTNQLKSMTWDSFKLSKGIPAGVPVSLNETKSGRGIATVGNARVLTSQFFDFDGEWYVHRSYNRIKKDEDGKEIISEWELPFGVTEMWFLSNKAKSITQKASINNIKDTNQFKTMTLKEFKAFKGIEAVPLKFYPSKSKESKRLIASFGNYMMMTTEEFDIKEPVFVYQSHGHKDENGDVVPWSFSRPGQEHLEEMWIFSNQKPMQTKEKIPSFDEKKLDKDNIIFNDAVELIKHTNQIIYLTGKAGTGKTTFLKYIKQTTQKNTVIVAPTGVAAINAGGVTINSFFQIPFSPFLPDDERLQTREIIFANFQYNETKRNIIENLELLIIDEVSMVRCDTIDIIDRILKVFRRKPYLPFGGVQVLLIGDTFQLPPIVKSEIWKILSPYYQAPFFFNAKAIEQDKLVYIELEKVYRQKEEDFISLLNKVRINDITQKEIDYLNSRYKPNFNDTQSDYIVLSTHNETVDEINESKLEVLEGKEFTYQGIVEYDFPLSKMPTNEELNLKEGAQVMFIKNDKDGRYFNGKIGRVDELEEDEIIVVFDDETKVSVSRTTWENVEYKYEGSRITEKVIGTFKQFPLKLAWAITVHKSQGLTFEKVIADLGNAFAAGQVYVALSRCTSFNGLVLKTRINRNAIRVNPNVIEFANNKTPDTLITEKLNIGKADSYYQKARENFTNDFPEKAWEYLLKAIKYRNDIETEEFKRYFLIYAQKSLLIKKEKQRLQDKVVKLYGEISRKDTELKAKKETIQEQNKQAKSDRYTIQSQKRQIKYLEERLSSSQQDIQRQERSWRVQEFDLTNKLHATEQREKGLLEEIKRLKNIKWYQKLFGKY